MFVFEKKIANYIAAALVLLEHKGQNRFAEVLRVGKYDLETETGYDNWNGGQYSHTLRMIVPMDVFETVSDDLSDCQQALMDAINKVSNDVKNESLEAVGVSPDVDRVKVNGLARIQKGTIVKTAFDEYKIERVIGEGGNGRVFAAKNADGEPVAIKFLERISSNKRKRFKNEIAFCEKYNHRNIVQVLDRGSVEVQGVDRIFCVMPLYEESLRTKIERGLSPEDSLCVITELLDALGCAHRAGVVHRDVKPENIMFAHNSLHPILCDFGIAHLPFELKETAVLTKPTDRMANFAYAAPEQKMGDNGQVGPQADLYACGLILNELFTRQIPAGEGYKKIGDVAPEYSFLDAVFIALYQQDPSNRISPAEKVIEEIAVRASIDKNERALRRLEECCVENAQKDWRDLTVKGMSYKEPNLVFEFSERIPDEWLAILQAGSYNHTSMVGCETHMVVRVSEKSLSIPLDVRDSDEAIRQKISYFSDWVRSTNEKYREHIAYLYRQEMLRREAERKHEVARLKNENRIRGLLSRL